jgi:hypothetical protein
MHPQEANESLKQSTDASSTSAGINETKMARVRLMIISTQFAFERSIKSFAVARQKLKTRAKPLNNRNPRKCRAPITKPSGAYNQGQRNS